MHFVPYRSHSTLHKSPFGAIPAGEEITFRAILPRHMRCRGVTLRWGDYDGAWEGSLPFWWEGMEGDQEEWWQCRLTLREPGLYRYRFIYDSESGGGWIGDEEQGVGRLGEGGWFRLTVYDPTQQLPDWVPGGVLYQIFPDRFCNSGRAKEGVPEDRILRQDWHGEPQWEPDERGKITRYDFFGGDLNGIEEKLGYLKSLGVTCIYLNPIFLAHSNHRYDTSDYFAIDPLLGTEEDFTHLCDQAHGMGIRIILDGVFSHTGADSQYFNRYGHYDSLGAYQSPDSPYYSWYKFDEFPDHYNAWWGIYTLPAVDKDNPGYQRYLLNPDDGILPRWVKRGASGWRLDVADELPVPMLQKMRESVKQANPGAVLIGEVWEDASNKVAYGEQRSYCLGDTVDSVMNYPLRRAVIDFFTGVIDAYQLRRVILHQREVYPTPFYYAMMNLLGSHDRVRILNAMAGFDREGAVQLPREESMLIKLAKPEVTKAKKRHLEALKLLCALPGAPTVYYGDEIGMQGMADPWNRAPMEWEFGDATHWSAISTILNERQEKRVLQTGFLDVEAVNENSLRIRRYAVDGKDVFGNELAELDEFVRIVRKL